MRALFLLLLAGCADAPPDDGETVCPDRAGGALITFDVVGESFTAWITEPAFIDAAVAHVAAGTTQVPNFGQVLAGSDCADPRWGFHVDPADLEFADFTTEVCDGVPSYVDENLEDWMDQVGRWCPWGAEVVSVEDRR